MQDPHIFLCEVVRGHGGGTRYNQSCSLFTITNIWIVRKLEKLSYVSNAGTVKVKIEADNNPVKSKMPGSLFPTNKASLG